MTIGQRMKARRKELGLSVDEIAKRLGKDRSTVYRYEKGDIENLSIDMLVPIANILDMDPRKLAGWDSEEVNAAYQDQKDSLNYEVEKDAQILKILSSTGNFTADFSKNIKALRNARHLSLAEISEEIGIPVTEIKKYEENTVSDVPLSALVKFADFFNTSIEDLIGIRYIIPGKTDATVTLISGNPQIISSQEKWQNEVGTIEFSEDELDKLIEFAKLLISARK